jgi:hypothetical protein
MTDMRPMDEPDAETEAEIARLWPFMYIGEESVPALETHHDATRYREDRPSWFIGRDEERDGAWRQCAAWGYTRERVAVLCLESLESLLRDDVVMYLAASVENRTKDPATAAWQRDFAERIAAALMPGGAL